MSETGCAGAGRKLRVCPDGWYTPFATVANEIVFGPTLEKHKSMSECAPSNLNHIALRHVQSPAMLAQAAQSSSPTPSLNADGARHPAIPSCGPARTAQF